MNHLELLEAEVIHYSSLAKIVSAIIIFHITGSKSNRIRKANQNQRLIMQLVYRYGELEDLI
jgi:hypothetical protein